MNRLRLHHRCGAVAPLLVAMLIASSRAAALAGGVHKIDDTVLTGEIVGFDGTTLTIETKTNGEGDQSVRQAIAVEDLVSVRFAGAAPTTAPSGAVAAGKPIAPTPAARQLYASVLRRIGLLSDASAANAEATGAGGRDAQPASSSAPPSTQPIALPSVWQLKLANGDALRGTPQSWMDQHLAFALQSTAAVLNIPNDRVLELWHAPPELIRKARALKPEAGAEDVAYVLKDADLVAVTGLALGIENDALRFRYEGEDRTINLNRLVGVRLAPSRSAAATGTNAFHQAVRLAGGDVVSGQWKNLNAGSVELVTSWNQTLNLPTARVTSIDFRNGRLIYLSDLEPAKVEQTPYFDRVMPWRRDAALGGGKLTLADGTYERGVAVHSKCALHYDLGTSFERFRCKLGFEQPAGAMGRAAVRVLADGKPLFENSNARGDRPPEELDLDVRGAKSLVLEVDFGEDQDVGDRVIFANARLLRAEVGQ